MSLAKEPLLLDFRLHLQAELERRCKENPSYSLRAFARFLTIDSSVLSKILNNKRTITPQMFDRLAERMGLSPNERARYLDDGRSGAHSPERTELTHDEFQTISRWYHFAILELTNVKGFRSDPKFIAKQLGITVSEVNFALERLERMGMLRRHADGRLTKSGDFTTNKSADTSVALRNMQKSILDQAKSALDHVPPKYRDSSTVTVAIDIAKIDLAKEMIKRFRRHLSDLLSPDHEGDAVYQLTCHLFPVSEIEPVTSNRSGEPYDQLH